MSVDYAKAIAAVEVFALREVREAPTLGSLEADNQFKQLILDLVTKIVEEHLAQGVRLGGRHIDGEEDGDGDGPRLHAWLEQRSATYTMVLLRFDYETRTPPIVTDTMAIVHGERRLIGKFVVFREPRTGSMVIEHVPSGRFSDDRRAVERPRRPNAPTKPVVHRVCQALMSWWSGTGDGFASFACDIRRRAKAVGHVIAVPWPMQRITWLGPFMKAVPPLANKRSRIERSARPSAGSKEVLAEKSLGLARPLVIQPGNAAQCVELSELPGMRKLPVHSEDASTRSKTSVEQSRISSL